MSNPIQGNQSFSKVQNVASTSIQKLLVDDIKSTNILSSSNCVGIEVLTNANNGQNVSLDVTVTLLDSSSGSFNVTLPNGIRKGQLKYFSSIGNSNTPTVTFPNNMYVLTGNYTFSLSNEVPALFVWSGAKWAALSDIRYYD